MPVVWIPAPLRGLTGGAQTVRVAGDDVGQVLDALERLHPGVRARLCDGDRLRPGVAVAVGTEVARQGLREPVGPDSEVHFLPAVSGGAGMGSRP